MCSAAPTTVVILLLIFGLTLIKLKSLKREAHFTFPVLAALIACLVLLRHQAFGHIDKRLIDVQSCLRAGLDHLEVLAFS